MNLFNMGAMAAAGGFIAWQMGSVGPWETPTSVEAPAGKITVVSDQMMPETGEAPTDFATFSSEPNYFGAFAMTKEGKPGYTYLHNSLEAAKKEAVVFCGNKHSAPCTVYAIMTPADAQDDLPEPMSADSASAFREYQQANGHGAFAIADNGAFGMTWDWDQPKPARREALSICAGYAADEAASDQEFTRCRVVAYN